MPIFNPQMKMKVRGVNGEINLSQPRQLSAIPQVDIFDPKTSEQVQMAAQQQRNAMMSDPNTFGGGAPLAPATPQSPAYTGMGWAQSMLGSIDKAQEQSDAAHAEDIALQKSEMARKRIGAIADAIASVGNAYGVDRGGYNQTAAPVAYNTISQRVAQDAALRRANMAALDNRLNSLRSQVLSAYLGGRKADLAEAELALKRDREGRLRGTSDWKRDYSFQKLDWDKEKTGINTDFNYAKLGETKRHNQVSETNDAIRAGASATSASASYSRAQTSRDKLDALLSGKLPTGKGMRTASGVDESVAAAAKDENWESTKDGLAQSVFGKDKWRDVRVSELTPEQKKVYEQIAGANNQKDRTAVIVEVNNSYGGGASSGASAGTGFKDPRKTPPSRRNNGGSGGSETLNDTIPSRRAK